MDEDVLNKALNELKRLIKSEVDKDENISLPINIKEEKDPLDLLVKQEINLEFNETDALKTNTTSNPKTEEENQPYKCPECDFKTAHNQHLNNHIKSIHRGEKRFSCNICEYTSFYKHLVAQHQKHQHRDRQQETKIKRIGCDKCEENIQHSSCIKDVERKNVKIEKKSSDATEKSQVQSNSTSSELKGIEGNDESYSINDSTGMEPQPVKHEQKFENNDEVYTCSECVYETRHENNLKNHIKNVHNGIKRFSCNLCNYTSFYKHHVKDHQKFKHRDMDIKVKRVGCEKCDSDFDIQHSCLAGNEKRDKVKPKSNEKVSKEIQDLSCKNDTAAENGNMQPNTESLQINGNEESLNRDESAGLEPIKHEQKYEDNSEVYTCSECVYETNHENNLKNHIKIIHRGIKRFSCNLCTYASFFKHHVRYHQKYKHRDMDAKILRFGCEKCANDIQHSCLSVIKRTDKKIKPKSNRKVSNEKKEFSCEKCDFSTNYLMSLQNHNKSVHEGLNRFLCSLCPHTAYYRHVVKSHQRTRHEKEGRVKKIGCTMCDQDKQHRQCVTEAQRIKRRRNGIKRGPKKDNEGNIRCQQCEFVTNKVAKLKGHTKSFHEGVVRFSCNLCDYTSYFKHLVRAHQRPTQIHKDGGTYVKRIGCDKCDQRIKHRICLTEDGTEDLNTMDNLTRTCDYCTFMTQGDRQLRAHIKSSHPGKTLFNCDKCDYKSNWLGNLKVHKASLHEAVIYSCDKCDYTNKWRPPFLEHKREKHGEFIRNSKYSEDLVFKEILCDVCGFKAQSRKSLRIHEESQHQQSFICEDCGHIASSLKAYKHHTYMKHVTQKFSKCGECGFKAGNPYRLNTHKYTVHKVDATTCTQCGLTVKNRFVLLIHIKNKHPAIDLKCDKCDFKAISLNQLRQHIGKVHEGIVHKCKYCPYEGPSKGHLHMHCRRVHAEQYLKCSKCEHRASSYLDLKSHITSDHG